MKNKFYILILCFTVMIVVVNPSYAKYTESSTGFLYSTTFTDKKMVATEYIIKDTETGIDTSDNLWGDEIKPGDNLTANGSFNMNNLSHVEFSVSNPTDQKMYISFVIEFYANPSTNFTINSTVRNKESAITESYLTDVVKQTESNNPTISYYTSIVKDSSNTANANFIFINAQYYRYILTIDPIDYFTKFGSGGLTEQEKKYIEDYYVLDKYDIQSFFMETTYDGTKIFGYDLVIYNTYSTIKMIAKPYTL